MSRVWGLVDTRPGSPARTGNGVTVDEVLSRLEGGEPPPRVLSALDLNPAEFLAVLGHAALGDEQGEGIELIQSPPPRPWLEPILSHDQAWKAILPKGSRPARLALAAGLLQIHNFWELSHEAAQEADNQGERAVSAYWHGIAHRREPDAGNAAYWFRRVGQHPVYGTLAQAARPLLDSSPEPGQTDRLLEGHRWNPLNFIAFCRDGKVAPLLAPLARRIQRQEMIALLEATAAEVGLA